MTRRTVQMSCPIIAVFTRAQTQEAIFVFDMFSATKVAKASSRELPRTTARTSHTMHNHFLSLHSLQRSNLFLVSADGSLTVHVRRIWSDGQHLLAFVT